MALPWNEEFGRWQSAGPSSINASTDRRAVYNSYFVSVFTAPSETHTLSAPFTSSHPTLNELEIPVEMVLTSLKQLDINKATGSDGIPVRLLKETADQISPSLTMLFNKSLRLGIFRETGNSRILYPFSRKERETLWRITALFPFSLSCPKFSSAAFWRVYEIIYPTSSVANSMAFKLVDLVWLRWPVSYITLAVNSTRVNK